MLCILLVISVFCMQSLLEKMQLKEEVRKTRKHEERRQRRRAVPLKAQEDVEGGEGEKDNEGGQGKVTKGDEKSCAPPPRAATLKCGSSWHWSFVSVP